MCASAHRCLCIHGIGSKVIRIALYMPEMQEIIATLRLQEFPRLRRLEVFLSQAQLPPPNVTIWQGLWGLLMASSSVQNLTVDFGLPIFDKHTRSCVHQCAHVCICAAHLLAAIATPGIALRHITLRGTPATPTMRDVASGVVAMSSQLDTLQLVQLDPFLWNALDNTMPTDRVAFACRQLQFSSMDFIPPHFNASEMSTGWDRLFGDPRLQRIVVTDFWSCCELPPVNDMKDIPVMVPGRRVMINLRDQADCTGTFGFTVLGWLQRLAATATEVEFFGEMLI